MLCPATIWSKLCGAADKPQSAVGLLKQSGPGHGLPQGTQRKQQANDIQCKEHQKRRDHARFSRWQRVNDVSAFATHAAQKDKRISCGGSEPKRERCGQCRAKCPASSRARDHVRALDIANCRDWVQKTAHPMISANQCQYRAVDRDCERDSHGLQLSERYDRYGS